MDLNSPHLLVRPDDLPCFSHQTFHSLYQTCPLQFPGAITGFKVRLDALMFDNDISEVRDAQRD